MNIIDGLLQLKKAIKNLRVNIKNCYFNFEINIIENINFFKDII